MSKFRFKKGREQLPENDIQQHMNFDKFMSGYTPPVKGWFAGGTKLFTIVSSGTALLVLAGYLLYTSGQTAQTHTQAFISPPLPALNPLSDVFIFNTAADTTLLHSTGSMISIPQNAFADEKGMPVKGKIEIRYREFHDPVDIAFSGIPMNYDSAGANYLLESAGMFEITASQNGKPVFLQAGKELAVNMISHTNNATDYNIYHLDTVKRQWEYIAENTAATNSCIPVFNAEPRMKKKMEEENTALALSRPLLPKKADHTADNFSIDYRKDEFPELAAYSGLKFEPVKGDKNYDPSLAKKTWDEVLIKKHPDNEHYIVTFSREKESHSFTVSPVVDEKNYGAAVIDFEARQKQYEALLLAKKENDRMKSDSLYRLNSRFAGLSVKSDLNQRFRNFISNSYMETSQDQLTYRTFAIRKLGIWNSDRPFPVPPSARVYAAQFTSGNEPLMLKNVFFLKRNQNGLFSIPERNFNRFPDAVASVDVMIGITYENTVVYLKDEELKKVKASGNTIIFNMNRAGAGISTPQQLKQLLKI
jgi:hypothetical protein